MREKQTLGDRLKNNLLKEVTKSDSPIASVRDALRSYGLALPKSIVLIPDGNGRWAQKQKPPLPISEGHKKGAETIVNLLKESFALSDGSKNSVKSIFIWVASPENITKRDPQEVERLLELTEWYLESLYPELQEANARFVHLGGKEELPEILSSALTYSEEATKNNTGVTVALGINYNGDQADYEAVNKAIDHFEETGRRATRQEWLALRDDHNLGQADLVIRPGGERRLSNLGWIAANGELVFSPVLMPDFTSVDLAKALVEYAFRQRRAGGRIASNAA